eukprot:3422330-Pyramimonas_sp.AAC.1
MSVCSGSGLCTQQALIRQRGKMSIGTSAVIHANDMLEALGGLQMSGWVAEGAGCILGGG